MLVEISAAGKLVAFRLPRAGYLAGNCTNNWR